MPERGSEHILVVDDEMAVLSLAQSMLGRYGYHAIIAPNAAEVLHLLDVWPDLQIDLALVDIVMPVMDGIELAERLRKLRPTLPIVFITAYSENERLRPMNTKGAPLLAKPFSSLKLIGKVREVLDSQQSSAAGSKQS